MHLQVNNAKPSPLINLSFTSKNNETKIADLLIK